MTLVAAVIYSLHHAAIAPFTIHQKTETAMQEREVPLKTMSQVIIARSLGSYPLLLSLRVHNMLGGVASHTDNIPHYQSEQTRTFILKYTIRGLFGTNCGNLQQQMCMNPFRRLACVPNTGANDGISPSLRLQTLHASAPIVTQATVCVINEPLTVSIEVSLYFGEHM